MLADKDPLIASAALSALLEYNSPPLDDENLKKFLCTLIIEWKSASLSIKEKIERVFRNLEPAREPMKSRIRQVIEAERVPEVRFALEKVFAECMVTAPEAQSAQSAAEPAEGAATGQKPLPAQKARGAIAQLERRKRYLEARRRWIAGGKKGDPPSMEDYRL